MDLTDLMGLLEAETVPIHVHVGPGPCREIGALGMDLVGDDAQVARSLGAALRAAADFLDPQQ